MGKRGFMGLKLYWSPIDAVIAFVVGLIAVLLVYLAHPDLHPLAYAAGWLITTALIYQTGSELSARRKKISNARQ